MAQFCVYGVALPIAYWQLASLSARSILRFADMKDNFTRYHSFSRRLTQCQEWNELISFITRFPGTLLPVDHSALYLYDHINARLEFVASWNALTGETSLDRRGFSSIDCQACLTSELAGIRRVGLLCSLSDSNGGQPLDYCLPLKYDNFLVGLLRVRCQPGRRLQHDQIEFMNAASPQIALALAVLIAYPREIAQAQARTYHNDRRQIAYELHNSLAQQIGYLHLGLDRLANDYRLLKLDEIRGELENMRQAADEAYERVRHTLSRLRAPEVVNLSQAIADLVQRAARTGGLQCEISVRGEPRLLSPPVDQQTLSVVREGLNNIVKHAQAERVQLVMSWSADRLDIELADDGLGFDSASLPSDGHYGLVMMREQVADLHGKLNIDSSPGHGTRLQLWFPIPPFPALADRSAAAETQPTQLPDG